MKVDSRISISIKGKNHEFIVEGYLNGGGNGQVYHVSSKSENLTDKYVAKFFYCKNRRLREKRYTRFKNEVDALLEIEDKVSGVLPVIDNNVPDIYSEDIDKGWFVMPLASSSDWLFKDTTAIKTKIAYLLELGEIIQQVHQTGKAHRDIKPANILLKDNHIKLSDFGLVWSEEIDGLTETDEAIGPYMFIAPEMRRNAKENKRPDLADIYSFGQVIWCMFINELKGKGVSFDIEDPSILFDNMYKDYNLEPIYQLICGATSQNPFFRPSTGKCLYYLSEFQKLLYNDVDTLKKWNLISISRKIDSGYLPNRKVYTEIGTIANIINTLIISYKIKCNAVTSEMVLDNCRVYDKGLLLTRRITGISKTEYLCFPESLICIYSDEKIHYELKLRKFDLKRDQYSKFSNIKANSSIPALIGDSKKIINLDTTFEFIEM